MTKAEGGCTHRRAHYNTISVPSYYILKHLQTFDPMWGYKGYTSKRVGDLQGVLPRYSYCGDCAWYKFKLYDHQGSIVAHIDPMHIFHH